MNVNTPLKDGMLDKLREIVNDKQYQEVDGVVVDMFTASAVVQVADALGPENFEKYTALPLNKAAAKALFIKNCFGGIGFESYQLKNNNANIRRVKQRIAELEAQADDETTEQEKYGVKIVDNVDENRIQLFFPGKPSQTTRTALKRNGFRWSRYNVCWQAYRTAAWKVDSILEIYKEAK